MSILLDVIAGLTDVLIGFGVACADALRVQGNLVNPTARRRRACSAPLQLSTTVVFCRHSVLLTGHTVPGKLAPFPGSRHAEIVERIGASGRCTHQDLFLDRRNSLSRGVLVGNDNARRTSGEAVVDRVVRRRIVVT